MLPLILVGLLLGAGLTKNISHYVMASAKTVDEIKDATITVINKTKEPLSVDIEVAIFGQLYGTTYFGWLHIKDLAPGQSKEINLSEAFSYDPSLFMQLGALPGYVKLDIAVKHYRINNGPDREIRWHAPVKVITFGQEGVSFRSK